MQSFNHNALVCSSATMLGLLGGAASMADITPIADQAAWTLQMSSIEVADFEFEGSVGDTYPGAHFSGAGFAWEPMTTVDFPLSGARSMYTAGDPLGNATPWDVTFDTPQRGFALHVHDLQAETFGDTTISFYNESGDLLDTFGLDATGAGHGQAEWGFNGFVSDSEDIARVVVTPPNPELYGGSAGSDALWYDRVAWAACASLVDCAGDVDGSGQVGVSDLLIMLAAWGPCADACDCASDFDGDGDVAISDLLILLAGWGDCA